MNQLTNEQIARVFAMYSGVEVDLSQTGWYKTEKETRGRFLKAHIIGVNFSEQGGLLAGCAVRHNIITQNNGLQWLSFTALKLKLTPLSSISDEDAIEVETLFIGGPQKSYFWPDGKKMTRLHNIEMAKISNCKRYFHERIELIRLKGEAAPQISFGLHQYLIQKGYAVPLFIEPNHPLNGKTAIELGIAIELEETS